MKIDFFTHFVPEKYRNSLAKIGQQSSHGGPPTLSDLDQRFRIMDKYEGLRQVLTLSPTASLIFQDPVRSVEFSKLANDLLAETVEKYPDRFAAGVASFPIADMDAGLKELERAIEKLRLKGVLLFTPIKGEPLDLPLISPILERMLHYDLPIWLHPAAERTSNDKKKFYVDHIFGWPFATTAAMTHLVLSGLFERYPGIKIVTHHCGAMIPFFVQRIAESLYGADCADSGVQLNRPLVDYFKMFYGDTALNGNTPALMCGHATLGADHLLFGTDMPFDPEFGDRSIRMTIKAIDDMKISEEEKQMIFEKNARRLLRQKL
jgi:predicted TIM-barrel fold metal-dependent hydrolase